MADALTWKQIVEKAQQVRSLSDYDAAVFALRQEWGAGARVWFRGHRDAEWNLHPLGLRKRVPPKSEHDLFVEFKRRARGLIDHLPTTEWAWLYLAQHHGLPTRLLDWTESAHVGLFFALHGKLGSTPTDCDACVWILNLPRSRRPLRRTRA